MSSGVLLSPLDEEEEVKHSQKRALGGPLMLKVSLLFSLSGKKVKSFPRMEKALDKLEGEKAGERLLAKGCHSLPLPSPLS